MPFRDDNIGTQEAIESRKPGSKRNAQKDKRNKKRGIGKGPGTSGTGVKYSIVGNIITLSAGQDNPANELTSDLVGATISVSNPHTIIKDDIYTTANGFTLPTSYSTQISKVINSKTFEVVEPYYVTDRNGKRFAASLNPGSITITYDTFKTETEDSIYQRSYANLTIGNLRTFSGDVYKAKIYYRPSLATTDFEEIYDTFVVPENVLVDSNSLNQFENIGFFHTDSIIDNNWISSSTAGDTGRFVTLTNEKLIDGLEISGSVSGLDDKVNFRTKNSFDLENGVDYVVRFNSYYYKSISEKRDSNNSTSDKSYASMKVFLSGSALTGNSGESDFFLGEVDIPDTSADEGLVENVIGRFRSSGDGSPKAWLKFELNSGKFHIQDVSVEPFSETNFNPSFFKVLVPMPIPQGKRVDKYDFLVEFYDSNNNLAETTAQINGVQFLGPRQVIADGLDAVFSGSMVIGESMEMFGVNPAYLRSVGYQGFDKTIFSGSGGFMMFSGSVGSRITASESYEGVGLEIVDAHGDTDRFLKFRTNPSEFTVQTDQFFLGKDGQFISGSNGTIAISSSNFFLGDNGGAFLSGSSGNLQISSDNFSVSATGDVTASGFISASGGHIGNFTLDAGRISGSNITMDANNSTIFKTDQGPGSDTTAAFPQLKNEYYIDFTPEEESPDNFFIKMGPNFMVDKDGILIASGATFEGSITASAGLIGGFTIGSASLFSGPNSTTTPFFLSGSGHTGTDFVKSNLVISSSGFQVNSTGEISSSAGRIGGFTLSDVGLRNANRSIELSSTTPSMSLGTGQEIMMRGVSNSPYIALQPSVDLQNKNFGEVGIFLGVETGATPKFSLVKDSNNQFLFNGNTLQIDTPKFSVSTGGNITATGGTIGGFTIGNTTIQGGNLILDKEGTIQSADFSSGNIAGSGKGFRLSALDNGFLEVENARIRGTLSTAVFEKETVNAVGGQLLIGNSTTITGSGGLTGVTASSATMSVENVSGFTGSYNGFNAVGTLTDIDSVDGEILLIKKVDNTGFSTEYVCVQSASFNEPGNTDINPSGLLYVTRSFGLGTETLGQGPGSNFTGSIGEGAKNYEDGQVIVSTGKYISGTGENTVGTGYINLNARPTDGATPYIDIVERTGSKVYEMDLKARLGDLSGLSSAQVGSSPGFGLFTDRAFLTKDVTIGTLATEHITVDGTSIKFKNGTNVEAELKDGTLTLGGPDTTTADTVVLDGSSVSIYGNDVNTGIFLTNDQIEIKGDANNDKVIIDNDGFKVHSGASGDLVGSFIGNTITLGNESNENVLIGNTGIFIRNGGDISARYAETSKIFDRQNNNTFVEVGDNGIIFVSGSITGSEFGHANGKFTASFFGAADKQERVEITDDGMEVYQGNTTKAIFGTNTTLTGGTITLQGGTNNHEQLLLENNSISIKANQKTVFNITGDTMKLGIDEDDSAFAQINGSTLDFITDSSGTNTTRASFGTNTTITGGTIKLQNSSTIFSEVSSAGLKVHLGDATDPVAIFGRNVTLGNDQASSGEKHQILLDTTGGSTGVTVKDGDNIDIAFIGSSAEVAGRTMEGALPNTAAVRGIVTDGLTGNSLSITGSANVGGLFASGSIRNTSTGAATTVMIQASGSAGAVFQVSSDGEVKARDNISAFTSAFTNISDQRLKTDIQTMTGSLNKILQLRPTEFTWIENGKSDTGFIAQEVERIIPDVVYETKGFTDISSDEQNDEIYKTISYNKLTTYLVDTIQELTKRVEDLEKQNTRVEVD